ncbi:MAG: Na+/H+ antiporter subunit E [Ignisphaera sp.]
MKSLAKAVTPIIVAFVIYIIYTGAVTLYDIVTGAFVAILSGVALASMLVEDWRKSLDIKRFLYLIRYTIRYFIVDEVKSHLDVIKIGLSPKMPIKPGIVRVPIESRSDHGIMLVSISITNTPGTVVVDIDKEKGILYVNWIYVKSVEPLECYKEIAQTFDYYAKKIFD